MSHYTGKPGLIIKTIHSLFGLLDSAVYGLIVNIYKLFFAVSTSTIIDGDVAREFYLRIQLILGIFMIFKLAISILNLIINPDVLKDKNAGTGKIVLRVVLCLLMLTAVVPLNIPNAQPRTLNGYINDHGILFGALYAVQDRVLSDQIIARLLLGYQTTNTNTDASENPDTSLGETFEGMGQLLASTILKSFILVNVKDDTVEDICNGSESCENVYCPLEVQESGYLDEQATVETITDVVNLECNSNGDKFAFHYIIGISTIVGVIVAILLLGYTIDVAIRAIKLVILRVIAPIPIISYVDIKASKDGAFASWVKTLVSTYIDLFVRLAIIYFGIFIIATIVQTGSVPGITLGNGASGLLKAMTLVFIIVGLLFFMRQAPNFIKTMLGTKGVGFGPGISGALGFMGGFVSGGGIAGSLAAGATAANATSEAQAQGKAGPGGWSAGRNLVTQIRTGDDKRQAGMLNNAQRTFTRFAKNRAADNIGAGEDNVQFRKDRMLHDQAAYQEAETAYDLAKHGVHQTAATAYTDANGRTVNAGDYIDHDGNAITYTYVDAAGVTHTDNATQLTHLAQARDQRKNVYEDSQRKYEKIDKANKALGYQETEYEKVMDVRRHNRHIARRNTIRAASGGPGTYTENRQTRAGNMHNSGGGEAL